jgi:DNA mismatch endonuclease (patch repair protein)
MVTTLGKEVGIGVADFMSVEQRSAAMSAVRGKDTAIERSLRSSLHRRGFRFRKNVRGLPGQPDIVLPKYGFVIFVHGCFWHHHLNCKRSKLPSTRRDFWAKKIRDNVKRDQRQIRALRDRGWNVKVVWECNLRNDEQRVVEELVQRLE